MSMNNGAAHDSLKVHFSDGVRAFGSCTRRSCRRNARLKRHNTNGVGPRKMNIKYEGHIEMEMATVSIQHDKSRALVDFQIISLFSLIWSRDMRQIERV